MPELPEAIRLGRLVVSVCRPGNGRGQWATREEIAQRLLDADEEISDEQLTGILRRLVDCKQLQMVRQIAYGTVSYVVGSGWDYEELDSLEADICQVSRDHDDVAGYTDEDELKGWLHAFGTEGFDDRQLGSAIGHLMLIGHLQTPRPDHWESKGPRPTWLVEPRIHLA